MLPSIIFASPAGVAILLFLLAIITVVGIYGGLALARS